jgi:hypothetical protein
MGRVFFLVMIREMGEREREREREREKRDLLRDVIILDVVRRGPRN